jgi:cell division protein FtsL
MREFRGNTSVAHQLEQPRVPQIEKQPQKHGLTSGEKLVYLMSVVVCVVIASLVLSRHAMLTEINMEVQKLEREAAELTESNRQLSTEVDSLGSGERIRQFAEEKGMIRVRDLPAGKDDRG